MKLFKGINLLFWWFVNNNYLRNSLSRRWFLLSSACILILCQGCFSNSVINKVGEVRQSLKRSSLSVIETEKIGNYSLNYIVQRSFYWHNNNFIAQRWFSKVSPMSPVAIEKNVDLGALQWFELGAFTGIAKHKIINIKSTGNIPIVETYGGNYNIKLGVIRYNNLYIVFHQRLNLANRSTLYRTKSVTLYDLKYTPWYGYFLKVSLFPLAVVADIATSPLQLITYLISRKLKKGWG